MLIVNLHEPHHEKTNNLHRERKMQISFAVTDQRLCFHYTDSTIPLFIYSSFKPLAIFCAWTAQFVYIVFGTQIVVFHMHRLKYFAVS